MSSTIVVWIRALLGRGPVENSADRLEPAHV